MSADIVEIKHIMLPPSPREFKDIYVVFELMETDLHQARLRSSTRACLNNIARHAKPRSQAARAADELGAGLLGSLCCTPKTYERLFVRGLSCDGSQGGAPK